MKYKGPGSSIGVVCALSVQVAWWCIGKWPYKRQLICVQMSKWHYLTANSSAQARCLLLDGFREQEEWGCPGRELRAKVMTPTLVGWWPHLGAVPHVWAEPGWWQDLLMVQWSSHSTSWQNQVATREMKQGLLCHRHRLRSLAVCIWLLWAPQAGEGDSRDRAGHSSVVPAGSGS